MLKVSIQLHLDLYANLLKVRNYYEGKSKTNSLVENATIVESYEYQEGVSGESEKNFEVVPVTDNKEKKQGLFEKVRKLFKV